MTSIILITDPVNPPKVIRDYSISFPGNSGLRNVLVEWEVGFKLLFLIPKISFLNMCLGVHTSKCTLFNLKIVHSLETNGALVACISWTFSTLIVFTLSSDLLLVIFCSVIGQFNC